MHLVDVDFQVTRPRGARDRMGGQYSPATRTRQRRGRVGRIVPLARLQPRSSVTLYSFLFSLLSLRRGRVA